MGLPRVHYWRKTWSVFRGKKFYGKRKNRWQNHLYMCLDHEGKRGRQRNGKQCFIKHGINNLLPIPNGVLRLQINYRPRIPPARNIHDNSALKLSKESYIKNLNWVKSAKDIWFLKAVFYHQNIHGQCQSPMQVPLPTRVLLCTGSIQSSAHAQTHF